LIDRANVRFALVVTLALPLGVAAFGIQTHAAPRSSSWNVEVVRKDDNWHHYYRRHGNDWRRYYRPPATPTPIRPLSCGEFRFWNDERCVDVRFR